MIDYVKYREYLNELVRRYKENKSLAGISKLAKKYGVTALTKEYFFEKGFNLRDKEFTLEEVKVIRDDVSKFRCIKSASRYVKEDDDNVTTTDGNTFESRLDYLKVPNGFELVEICKNGNYRYALKCDSEIFNASCCMYFINHNHSKVAHDLYGRLSKMLNDTVVELYEGRVPLPCVNGDMDYASLYMAKCSNNDTYFLTGSVRILVGLAWICNDLEKENKPKWLRYEKEGRFLDSDKNC